MAEHARRLIAGNPSLGQRISVIRGKVEEVEFPEKGDILISEPMANGGPKQLPVTPQQPTANIYNGWTRNN
ncbi:putative histone-arginine methyltransferase CARM1 [Acorus gramineus]|uniref:Histone-arginine methyltransferase CARM1 n=1 Tax=Acorus gramineus TaxID=55184 RepID=A0AAV9BVJ8_ACOGR|nr:putative histone-arginine methyltransferase CARM1 [Acorus gramineus]